jgi:hypothetical protein
MPGVFLGPVAFPQRGKIRTSLACETNRNKFWTGIPDPACGVNAAQTLTVDEAMRISITASGAGAYSGVIGRYITLDSREAEAVP